MYNTKALDAIGRPWRDYPLSTSFRRRQQTGRHRYGSLDTSPAAAGRHSRANGNGRGNPAAHSAQTATPKRGGTVTVALVQAPPSLDAQLTSAQVARDINLHMYETLYARDENAGVVPDLAQGAEVSKDGMTYVFALRPGVKFHNGKTMDCQGRGCVAGALPQDRAGIDPVERCRQDGGVRAARGDGAAEEGAVEFPRHAVLAGHAARDLSGRGGRQGSEGLQVHRHRPDEVRRIRAGQPRHAGAVRRLRAEPELHQARRFRGQEGDVHRPRDIPLHAGIRRAHGGDQDRRSADQRNH